MNWRLNSVVIEVQERAISCLRLSARCFRASLARFTLLRCVPDFTFLEPSLKIVNLGIQLLGKYWFFVSLPYMFTCCFLTLNLIISG